MIGLLKDASPFPIEKFRPWKDADGKSWVTMNHVTTRWEGPGEAPLYRHQWHIIDKIVLEEFRHHAPVTHLLMTKQGTLDLRKMMDTFKHEQSIACNDKADKPVFETRTYPLPFIYKDFPLEGQGYTQVGLATQEVASDVEKMVLGVNVPFTIQGMEPLYGFMNFPERWTLHDDYRPEEAVQKMVYLLRKGRYFGSYTLIYGKHYMGETPEADKSFRWKMGEVSDRINVMYCSEQMKGRQLILFQETPDVIRIIFGLTPIVIWWEGKLRLLTITVPQPRAGVNGCGIAHFNPGD